MKLGKGVSFGIFIILIITLLISFIHGVGLVENRQWARNLTGMHHSALALGDINNDNKTDLILIGCTTGAVASCTSIGAYVYTNNGTNLNYNSSWSQNLTAVGRSSIVIGDIDNDGDLDLIIAGGSDYSTADITRVYTNNGSAFEKNNTWDQNLSNAKVFGGSLALGDVNNDGRLDLAISGADTSGTQGIYINNGSAFVKDNTWTPPSFPNGGMSLGIMALSWVDLDGDSRLDLVVMGSYSTTFYANIYINNGTSLVQNTSWEQNLPAAFGWPSTAFGDYDNDGDMDMIYMGTRVGDKLRVYNNNRNAFSSNQTEAGDNLIGIFDGAVAFGDYNNDGDLDIAAMGKEANYDRIYKNNNSLYVRDTNVMIDFQNDNLQQGSLLWNDIDNDGDLDLISIGKIGDTSIMNATIYMNNATLTVNNSIPYPPSNFDNHSLADGNIFLGWNNGSDNETISLGLYYNLRVGTTSGGNDIVSGVFGSSGRPTAGYFGNMMQRRNISLLGSRFSVGQTYYWSVQTIDTTLAKSEWSTEKTFNLTSDFTPPTITLNAPEDNLITNVTNITFNALVYDDNNLTNVSLYGNWSGGWHSNTTNISGINNTNYIFNVVIVEGTHLWGIRACDNTANCISSNQTFRIDTTYPIVSLISPTNGSSWTTTNTVNFTYNISDLGISNCSLMINGLTNRTNTSILVNQTQNFTTNLPNGNYNWSVRCSDQANNVNFTGNHTLTVSYTAPVDEPSSSPGGSSGGGGGGGGTASLNIVSRIIPLVIVGDNTITLTEAEKKNIGIEEVVINSNSPVSNAKIIMEKLSRKPADVESDPKGKTYSYLRFDKTILTDNNLESAVIKFTVNRSWVLDNNYRAEDVALSHYKTSWERLPTKFLSSDSVLYHYEAKTKGFSYFAINADINIENKERVSKNKTESKEVINEESQQEEPDLEIQKDNMGDKKRLYLLLIILSTITSLIIIIYTLTRLFKNKKEKKLNQK